MTTLRRHAVFETDADRLWAIIGDPVAVAGWFPSIASSEMHGSRRTCRLKRGGEVVEEIVTIDGTLRRLQYSIRAGIPVVSHLGTVDVIDLGDRRSVVVYGTDVEPAHLAAPIAASVDAALRALADLVR